MKIKRFMLDEKPQGPKIKVRLSKGNANELKIKEGRSFHTINLTDGSRKTTFRKDGSGCSAGDYLKFGDISCLLTVIKKSDLPTDAIKHIVNKLNRLLDDEVDREGRRVYLYQPQRHNRLLFNSN